MHDVNGKPLAVGDEVLLRAKITHLSGGEKFCNVTIQSVHPMPIEPYHGCDKCGHFSATTVAHNRWEQTSGQEVPCDGKFTTITGRKETFSSVNTRMLEKVE